MSSSSSWSYSSVSSGRMIDFDEAEVRRSPMQGEPHLWVKGRMPVPGFEVRLAPRIYHERPDYWDIEVSVTELHRPANDQGGEEISLNFERSVPLSGFTGVRGITVVGANQNKRIEISGESH